MPQLNLPEVPPPIFGSWKGKGGLVKTPPPGKCLAQICWALEPGRQFSDFPGKDKPWELLLSQP